MHNSDDAGRMPATHGRRLGFLVIEDDTVQSIDLEGVLESLGHSVVAAAGRVETALRTIEERDGDIDCALLDADLGGQSAVVVAERLRCKDIPYILVSGHAPARLRHLGFDGAHVRKPLNTAALEAVLVDIA